MHTRLAFARTCTHVLYAPPAKEYTSTQGAQYSKGVVHTDRCKQAQEHDLAGDGDRLEPAW